MKKLTKIDVSENPLTESAQSVEEYGKAVWASFYTNNPDAEHKSPNVGYWIAGQLLDDPTVGESIRMFRHIRNGETIPGLFSTSPVTHIVRDSELTDKMVVMTKNSVYTIEDYKE